MAWCLSNKEPLLLGELRPVKWILATSYTIRVKTEQEIFLFENVALYKKDLKFIKCFRDEMQ